MLSVDASILLYAYSEAVPEHDSALAFITAQSRNKNVDLSELVLTEFYLLLRNPVVMERPSSAQDAAQVVQSNRQHPIWKTLGFPPTSRKIHTDLWHQAATPGIARRRIKDTRTALWLRAFDVTEFATAKVKDFDGFGFNKVWNPTL
jgi:predicted nucleic acid-binding protein